LRCRVMATIQRAHCPQRQRGSKPALQQRSNCWARSTPRRCSAFHLQVSCALA
jgi:hypothetical protein